MQPGREREEQLVGDRVLVRPVRVPPQPAAAGVVPAAGDCASKIARAASRYRALPGQVVGGHPGQPPPAVVVEERLTKPRCPPRYRAARRGTSRDDPSVGPVPGAARVADHRGQRVGGVPPAGRPPPARPRRVPALQRGQPGGRLRAEVRLPDHWSVSSRAAHAAGGRADEGWNRRSRRLLDTTNTS